MQIRAEQLASHLERELLSIYTVYGDDPLLVIEAADSIRRAVRNHGFDEREVLTALPGFNWHDLSHTANSMSLFGSRKLIDLRIPNGKPGRDGSTALQDYCARPSPDTILLITLPALEWTDEKSVWFKTLSEAGAIIKPISPSLTELPNWISARLRQQKQSAEPQALRFIAERVEGNLLAAHQEIQKLALLFPERALSLEEVKVSVLNVARYVLDGLREALLNGDTLRLARTLEGLKQEGEAPPLVLWAMTEEIRALAQIKAGEGKKPLDALFKEAKIWGARQALFKRALPRLKRSQTEEALTEASRIDRLIKGIGTDNLWDSFLRLGLMLR